MADFNTALTITLRNEGGFSRNEKTGEIVNMGITSWFLEAHNLPATEADVQSLSLFQVTYLYQRYFWTPLLGVHILSQEIANKLFDIEVNQGGVAVKEMQQTVNDLVPSQLSSLPGPPLVVDGEMGPHTISVINLLPDTVLLPAFQARVAARYKEIAADNPLLADDLGAISPPSGWLGRLYS